MQLQKAIKKRRSIRHFKSKKPDWRDILDCLDATRYAPMAGGYFSLNFLIIDEKDKIEYIAQYSEQKWIKEAKYLVLFISDPSFIKTLYKEKTKLYLHQQAGAAAQNFMLSLTEKGLSTCWVGHFNEEKIKQKIELTGSKTIEMIFPIGYEKEKPKTRKIMAELFNRVNWNTIGNKRINPPKIIEHYGPLGYQ